MVRAGMAGGNSAFSQNCFRSPLKKEVPLSLCMKVGKPNKQKRVDRQSITVWDVIFLQGNVNGYRLNSSTTIKRYSRGPFTQPLKSIDNLSQGLLKLLWEFEFPDWKILALARHKLYRTGKHSFCFLASIRQIPGSHKMIQPCATWVA